MGRCKELYSNLPHSSGTYPDSVIVCDAIQDEIIELEDRVDALKKNLKEKQEIMFDEILERWSYKDIESAIEIIVMEKQFNNIKDSLIDHSRKKLSGDNK